MVTAAIIVAVVAAVLAVHLPTAAGMTMADKYNHSSIYYDIKVENRMPAKETMQIDCRLDFSLHFSLGPGQSGAGTFDAKQYYVYTRRDPNDVPRAYCTWAYAGNYMNHVMLFDVEWPEAARCSRGGGGHCTVVFDGEQLFVEAPGTPRRLLGDLAIKRCKKHYWFFGWVGSGCSLPPHQNNYVGSVLEGWWDYQRVLSDPNNR